LKPIPPRPDIKIVSMVTKADLCQRLDLENISTRLPGSSYNPKRFSGLFFYFMNPRITFVVFNSGKVTGYGGQTLKGVRRKFSKLMLDLEGVGIAGTEIKLPEITMLVGSAQTQVEFDLEKLSRKIPRIMYEPEQFPSLMWHFSEREVVLIFATGTIVVTGSKTVERLNQVYDEVLAILRSNALA